MRQDPDSARRADASKTKQYAPRLAPDDRREQLLDAALRIAVRWGFNEITMGNVAKACGVTRPVVYSQFRNRNDLVKAMIDREVSGAIDDLDAAIPDSDLLMDPRAAYLNGVRIFLTAVTSHPERWQIALAPPHGLPTEIRSMVEEQRSHVVTEIEHFLLLTSQTLIPEPELLSIMVVGMLERIATTMITEPGRLDLERVLNFAELMFDSLWGATFPTGRPVTDGGNAARGPSGPLRRRSSKSGKNREPATLALSTQVLQLRRRLLAGAGIITAITVLAMVGAFVASKHVVGDSMSPTIGHGARILTDPFASAPERFDLVVVRLDGNAESVKRVIGLPGDTIEIARSDDGSPPVVRVRPDGEDEWRRVTGPGLDDRWTDTPEDCCLPDGTSSPAGTGPQVVPDGHVFVLGDNPQHSADSRRFGWIDDDALVGVARWRVWPPGAVGGLGGGYDLEE